MSRQVTIKRLTLTNFKGIRNLAVEFGDSVTTISGRNGTGKTTIVDAFTWLLWGKDSDGNVDSKFGIKTNDEEGNAIPDLNHEVTGVFQVVDTETGEATEHELRRVYVEEWKTPRGSSERTLSGHHTDYFYNGVPLKTMSEYNGKVAAIIPENIVKVITDPYYFLNLHWKTQREYLLTMAGTIPDADIVAQRAEFGELLNRLTGKTAEEYRKEVSARRTKIEAALDKIPTRKDEVTRNTPATPDYLALQAEKEQIQAQLADIDAAAASVAEANRIAFEKAAGIQYRINELRGKQSEAVYRAAEAARTAAYEANRKADDAARELKRLQSEKIAAGLAYERDKASRERSLSYEQQSQEERLRQIARLRAKWEEVNNEQFQEKTYQAAGQLVCPLFGNVCADSSAVERHNCDAQTAAVAFAAKQDKAREDFYAEQNRRLDMMDSEGQKLKTAIAQGEATIAQLQAEIAELDSTHATNQADYAKWTAGCEATIAANPRVSTNPHIDPATLPEWVELNNEIAALTATMPQGSTPADTTDSRAKKAQLNARLSEIAAQEGLRAVIEANARRLGELDTEARQLAQAKAELQNEEDLIADFVRTRMAEVERRVNAMFGNVQFRMYKTLVNGEKEPDCVAYIGGVRYQDKNHAGQVNAGLDVINTLSGFHKITAPVFVDNAESVNEFIPTQSQLIRLVVSTDPNLTTTTTK